MRMLRMEMGQRTQQILCRNPMDMLFLKHSKSIRMLRMEMGHRSQQKLFQNPTNVMRARWTTRPKWKRYVYGTSNTLDSAPVPK